MPLRLLASAVALLCGASFFVMVAAASVVTTPFSNDQASADAGSSSIEGVPTSMLSLYQEAAAACPGLSWAVLAAIGTVESSNGTSQLPGVHSGSNYAGAEGPMQFEPGTFAEYDEPVPAGGARPPSPYDPVDAVYAASRLLCANGAANDADLPGAVFAYNHSTQYVQEVLTLAQSYESSPRNARGLGG